jgi:hypothetical protein
MGGKEEKRTRFKIHEQIRDENKENHMQSNIRVETRRVSEDLDTKTQNKRGRRTRRSWQQQGKRRRETYERK